MVEHLSTLVESFPGAANQTRCFAHILNLVAKSILRSFDAPKKAANGNVDDDDATDALAALAQELEDTAIEINDSDGTADDDDELDGEDDDDDGLGDGRDGMSEEELAKLKESLIPVRLMLTKVS